MCLLIVNPERKIIPLQHLKNAYASNSDGYGYALWDEEAGIQTAKAVKRKWVESFYQRVQELRPQIVHFRFGTHGPNNKSLAHPFRMSGYVAAHNGILHDVESLMPIEKGESDTTTFLNWLEWFKVDPFAEGVKEAIEYTIGNGNKFAFLRESDGKVLICNESAGSWKDGIWYSNCGGFHEPLPRYTYTGSTTAGSAAWNSGTSVLSPAQTWYGAVSQDAENFPKTYEFERSAVGNYINHSTLKLVREPGEPTGKVFPKKVVSIVKAPTLDEDGLQWIEETTTYDDGSKTMKYSRAGSTVTQALNDYEDEKAADKETKQRIDAIVKDAIEDVKGGMSLGKAAETRFAKRLTEMTDEEWEAFEIEANKLLDEDGDETSQYDLFSDEGTFLGDEIPQDQTSVLKLADKAALDAEGLDSSDSVLAADDEDADADNPFGEIDPDDLQLIDDTEKPDDFGVLCD